MVTAKIQCTSKIESGEGDERRAQLSFQADYADGRNKEWAAATPTLSLSMTVKGDVADQFEPSQRYTLQFVAEDQAEADKDETEA
jgi:hypothetical protein